MPQFELQQVGEALWEIPPRGKMRVPARIYASRKMVDTVQADNAPQQAANVACLPGIVKASLAMPDIHWGYGFPIGGVAAFDLDRGIISPGGVGYDINCGVRMLASNLTFDRIASKLPELIDSLFRTIPTGVGASGALRVSPGELRRVVVEGAGWAVKHGQGESSDLEFIEEQGCMAGALPDKISERAWQRGLEQLGTLGSGNHFLEIGQVDEIFDKTAAEVLGLFPGQITVMIHCGSRGFGYQVCDDYLGLMDRAARKYQIELPDRQLACAPIRSEEGHAYLGAMRCAVNYAFANREVIVHQCRQTLQRGLGMTSEEIGLRTVYEVAHNIAKIESHDVDGRQQQVCVHRKGATRAFAPESEDLPVRYRPIGQPVLIPGDMGRCSYVLIGTAQAMRDTFGSSCHGAGRALSRVKAKEAAQGRDIVRELAQSGVIVRGQSRRTLDEEISEAYKDVSEVVDTCACAGISRRVARLKPLGCIKG